jgi:hypothetical protein
MAPLDLETRLAEDLHRAAEAAPLQPPSLDAVRADAAQRSRRHRIRVAALAVAATVVVAAGAAALLARADADPDHTDIGRSPTTEPAPTTETTVPTTEPPATTPSTAPPATVPADDGLPGTAGPVVEELALRPDGIGPYDFGTPYDEIVPAVNALLGQPMSVTAPQPVVMGCVTQSRQGGTEPATPEGKYYAVVLWDEVVLDFDGPDERSLSLNGWRLSALQSDPRQMRMAGGPTVTEPLSAWRAAYGAQLDEQSSEQFVLNLPSGPVQVTTFQDPQLGEIRRLDAGTYCDPIGD